MAHRSPFRYFKASPEVIRLAVMLYIRQCQRSPGLSRDVALDSF